MNLKLSATIGWIYAALLVYASLMPFDFAFDGGMDKGFGSFWNYWPLNPGARVSGSDVLSNLVLYIPLGYIIAVRLRLGKFSRVSSLFVTGLICSIVSICVEFLQVYTISRTASVSDWLLNTISGTLGAVAGSFYGKKTWAEGIGWLKQNWAARPVAIAAVILAGLLAADSLSPFLPTILLKQVWQSFKMSNFNIVQGLSLHPWHWWFAQRILVYMILTFLFSGCISQGRGSKRFLHAASLGALFSFLMEIAKLFIVSRSFNMANVITSWVGCIFAVWIGLTFKGRITSKKKMDLAICFIIFYVCYLAWFPFDFTLDFERIQRVFPTPIKFLPLYDYAMGASLNHARLFAQSVFLMGTLVYVLRARFGWFENPKTALWLAAAFCGILGVLQESGQLFLASRTPAATDIYCFALGGVIGAWIKRHPGHDLK